MPDEIRAKLEALVVVECDPTTCGMDGEHSCARCLNTGKKWYPLDSLHIGFDSGAEVLCAVEQCLGMLGSWEYDYHPRMSLPHGYTLCNIDYPRGKRSTDRLTAVVECLWEAANE
jgi:hypothetical protein